MPHRSNPTARQLRLGAELRKMRERAGLTGREAARRLGVSPMQMSHLETARIGISEERLRLLASQYGCADAAFVNALVATATERGRGWWEEYRGVLEASYLDLAELEARAVRLRTLQVVHIPGVFQTEDYVRAIHTYASPVPPPEHLEAIVEFRLKRRRILEGGSPALVDAVIHEAALRIRVGDRKVARKQIETILALSHLSNVRVRVVPFDVDGFAGSGFSMLYAEGPLPQLDTVQLDAAHASVFLAAETQLASYRDLFAKVGKVALGVDESRDLMHRLAGEL